MFFIEEGLNRFSLISLKIGAKLRWSVRSYLFREENQACPVKRPIVLVF